MVKNPSIRPQSAKPPTDGDGNHIGNAILLGLARKKCKEVLPRLEFVRLELHHVLYEAGETMKSCYFVNAGMMSVLAVQPDGRSVEVGLVGKEGFVGLPLLVGYRSSPTRVVAQAEGAAYRCSSSDLRLLVRQCPELVVQLNRFAHRLAMQTTQIAACNRLHGVNERLARWILMTQDRVQSDHLPLTQEFLGQMLGTRRSTVTVSAGILQKAGLISQTRGSVTILDRKRLEEAACDCYGVIQQQLREWDAEN